VYDFMLKHGVKPIVELSFMPKALVTCGGKGEPDCSWSFGAPGSVRQTSFCRPGFPPPFVRDLCAC
jgi:hypothetical protein